MHKYSIITNMVMEQSVPSFELQFAHSDQILCDLCEALLALVSQKVRPILEMLVDLLERLGVVLREFDALPHVLRCVGTLDGLHVEENLTYRTGEQIQEFHVIHRENTRSVRSNYRKEAT